MRIDTSSQLSGQRPGDPLGAACSQSSATAASWPLPFSFSLHLDACGSHCSEREGGTSRPQPSACSVMVESRLRSCGRLAPPSLFFFLVQLGGDVCVGIWVWVGFPGLRTLLLSHFRAASPGLRPPFFPQPRASSPGLRSHSHSHPAFAPGAATCFHHLTNFSPRCPPQHVPHPSTHTSGLRFISQQMRPKHQSSIFPRRNKATA